MTGMLFLIDTLMSKPMKEIVAQMGLADAVAEALLNRKGHLGELLSIVESLEKSNYEIIGKLNVKCNVEMNPLYNAEQEAAKWTQSLTNVI